MVKVSSKHRKPILLKDQPSLEQSFIIKGDDIGSNIPWHFHLEVEVIYCIKAKGTNFIGNYVSPIVSALLKIISMLDVLARSDHFMFLNQVNFLSEANNVDSQKINKVFEYTGTHFRDPVTLSDVAELVNLTEGGFCRYL